MNEKVINEQIEEYIRNKEMAGGALVVRKNGDIVFENCWGYSDIQNQIPVTKDTVFRMASVSKAMSCVGFLKLVDSGKVTLEDKISDYIPEFKNPRVVSDERFAPDKFSMEAIPHLMEELKNGDIKTVSAERELTVRDMISHSCGLEMGIVGYLLAMQMDYKNDTIEERIKKYAAFPLDFQPGAATGYCPRAAFDTLSRITEIVSGKPFDIYMSEEVFQPLGMLSTSYRKIDGINENIAKLYTYENGKLVDVSGIKDIDGLGMIGDKYVSASAGVYSTMKDFDRFVTMLGLGGTWNGEKILSKEMVKQIGQETAYKHLEFSPGMSWGMGMLIRQNPTLAKSALKKGSYGWSGAYGTHFFVSPEDGITAAFCMNRENIGGSGSYISKRIEEMIYGG